MSYIILIDYGIYWVVYLFNCLVDWLLHGCSVVTCENTVVCCVVRLCVCMVFRYAVITYMVALCYPLTDAMVYCSALWAAIAR